MFEGTRLAYVVPGYTGHIPKTHFEQSGGYYVEEKPQNHIPGYAGYIQSMKAENLYGKTYGKTTYQIQHSDYYKGQEVPPHLRYKSQLQDTYQNQNNVQLRTAASIVGVPSKEIEYRIPNSQTASNFFKIDENGRSQLIEAHKQQNFGSGSQDLNQALHKFYGDEGEKEPLKLGTPLPGYTGTQKRVVAANIFGQTFANARKTALDDEEKIKHERRNNFKTQAISVPPLKR